MLNLSDFQVTDTSRRPRRGGPRVRKPKAKEDLRTHASWRWKGVRIVEHKANFYLVAGRAAAKLKERTETLDLIAAIAADDDSNRIFVWPLDLQDESTRIVADECTKHWRKVIWNGAERKYQSLDPQKDHGEPAWSFASFEELVESAFNARVVEKEDDPLIDEILGVSKPEAE